MISCKEYFESEKQRLKNGPFASYRYNLDIVQVGTDPASERYVRNKIKDCEDVGINWSLTKVSENIGEIRYSKLMDRVYNYSDNPTIVQRPLPNELESYSEIPGRRDVDGLAHDSKFLPCTVRGILDWLDANEIDLAGKNIVVIGRSRLVGKPLADEFLKRDATVTVCHSHTDIADIYHLCKYADIAVVAIGWKHYLKAYEMKTPLIIDVGINVGEDGKLYGDVDSSLLSTDGWIDQYVTPVPGGVGLLTRLALLKNVSEAPHEQ